MSNVELEASMPPKLKPGDDVTWSTSQGKTSGKVVKKVTTETRVKGHVAKATPDDPQYLVESDKTGARAVHKPKALKRR